MRRFAIVVAVLCLAAGTAAQSPAAVRKALTAFQGTWVLTTPDGQSMMPGGELALVIVDDKYTQTANGQVNERGTIKLDPAKKPMAIDLLITEGPDAGKTQVGLIEVKGDTMTGVLKVPGDTVRPTDMTPQPGVIAFLAKKKAT